MRKDILIIDWLMTIVFLIMIASKIKPMPFTLILQPIFMILIAIHIYQHRKIMLSSLKKTKK